MHAVLSLLPILLLLSTKTAVAHVSSFYQEQDYTLQTLPDSTRSAALELLSNNREFRLMRGMAGSCEEIHALADTQGNTVGYGSLCKTQHKYQAGLFCWDASGTHLGYTKKPVDTRADWVGDSILQGCGGVIVADSPPQQRTETKHSPGEEFPPRVDWGDTRPVFTMFDMDVEALGFDLPIDSCDEMRFIGELWLDDNESYSVVCEIDEDGKQALFCFDNLNEHFALFTRFYDTSRWAERIMRRYCGA
jgi:hypothetical protein